MTALATIPVGVLVARQKAQSAWADFTWRPTAVLVGTPAAAPWTMLDDDGSLATFYAGPAMVELYRTETANYRDNLAAASPSLWVVLRATGADPAYKVLTVTADPAEGEAATEAGNDLVEVVPMPQFIVDELTAFVAAHDISRPFFKRQREDATARRGKPPPGARGG